MPDGFLKVGNRFLGLTLFLVQYIRVNKFQTDFYEQWR